MLPAERSRGIFFLVLTALFGAAGALSVFKVIEATIPKEYDSLEKAIEMVNDLNRDFGLGNPVITKDGFWKI